MSERALVNRAPGSLQARENGSLINGNKGSAGTASVVPRSSTLPAPIMVLSGHTSEISSLSFSPKGGILASASHDRDIFIWRIGQVCENLLVFKGHKNAVLDVDWSQDSKTIYSCSADKSVRSWDVETGEQLAKKKGHHMYVTCVAVSKRANNTEVVASAGDDGDIMCWDFRYKYPTHEIATNLPVSALEIGHDGNTVYSGSVDNVIKAWDLRMLDAKDPTPLYELEGHGGTVVGLRISPDGTRLASNAHDSTVRGWNIRAHVGGAAAPHGAQPRHERALQGAPHDMSGNVTGSNSCPVRPAWSRRGAYLACGSADRTVVVWDYMTGSIQYKLPGHRGAVTSVAWSPREPVLASAGQDRVIYLGELHVAE